MGSAGDVIKSPEEAYILGLWCADGYHRTSSIGLSNVNTRLIERFGRYLREGFPKERLRLRVYVPAGAAVDKETVRKYNNVSLLTVKKARRVSYHIYVNSRSLLRQFFALKGELAKLRDDFIIPYLAGRFDGDGCAALSAKRYFRIVYGRREEAEEDKRLLERLGPYKVSIYHYRSANTYCLYVSEKNAASLMSELAAYSLNLQRIVARTP